MEYAINITLSNGWNITNDDVHTKERLQEAYQLSTYNNMQELNAMFTWCINQAKKRIIDIVSNTHRKAYERAALLTGTCCDVLSILNKLISTTKY